VPYPQGQHPVCGYPDYRQSGIFQGQDVKGNGGVLPKGGGFPYPAGRPRKYRFGGGSRRPLSSQPRISPLQLPIHQL